MHGPRGDSFDASAVDLAASLVEQADALIVAAGAGLGVAVFLPAPAMATGCPSLLPSTHNSTPHVPQETMYGQTNCWVLPEGKYGAYRVLDGDVYIMTERAALNLSYQVGADRARMGVGYKGYMCS